MGKIIKKVVNKVTKATGIKDPILGDDPDKAKADAAAATVAAAPVVAAPPPVAAAVVEAPKSTTDGTDEADTDAAKKAARAKGKRGLSVARSSGTGINI